MLEKKIPCFIHLWKPQKQKVNPKFYIFMLYNLYHDSLRLSSTDQKWSI